MIHMSKREGTSRAREFTFGDGPKVDRETGVVVQLLVWNVDSDRFGRDDGFGRTKLALAIQDGYHEAQVARPACRVCPQTVTVVSQPLEDIRDLRG